MRAALAALLFLTRLAMAEDSGTVLAWLDEPARLLTAGQQTTLSVLVTDASGSPVAGAPVLFQAPAAGPTGVLLPRDAGPASSLSVTSGDDGVAAVLLQAGTVRGSYLVEASTAGAKPVTFGISNVPPGAPPPALAASAMRRTVEAKLPAGALAHGPVWVPAFTSIAAGGPPSIFGSSATFTPSTPGTWLLWVDLNPGLLFGHPVQYITVDAGRNDFLLTTARYSRENWWPSVRLSGGAAVALLPPSAWNAADLSLLAPPDPAVGTAPPPPCAIVLYGPGAPGAQANFLRTTAFLQGGYASTLGQPATRDLIAQEVRRMLDGNCASVYFHLTANGFPPRTPRPDSPGVSLGGIVLADAGGAPADFVDYADLAQALLPLKAVPVDIAIEASYSGSAAAALSGQGLGGTVLTGADGATPQTTSNAGTPLNADLLRAWQAAPGSSFGDIAAGVAANPSADAAKSNPRAARLAPAGPKALAVPSFLLSAPGLFDRATLRLPDDFPAGVTPSLQITVANPLVADLDPRTLAATQSSELPPVTVYGSSPGVTSFQVQIGSGSAPLYQGVGGVAVGQEVSCWPSPLTLRDIDRGEIRVTPGTLYDPLYNGTRFTARLLNDRYIRLTNPDLAFADAATGDTLRFTALSPGSATVEIVGTRAFGPSYTACLVDINVIPSSGDGTSNTAFAVSETDTSLQRVSLNLRVGGTLGGQVLLSARTTEDDLLCTASTTPQYANIPASRQAFQQTVKGKTNAQVLCFYAHGSERSSVVQSSTFLGGTGTDTVTAMAADSQGNLWVTGTTTSTDFPLTAGSRKYAGNQDAFIAKISRFGDKLLFSTYFGGTSADVPTALAVDGAGDLYVTGYTYSPDLPVTNTAAQRVFGGGTDAFLAKFDGATGALRYSTYFGGLGSDAAAAVAVDAKGSAYIVGQTTSPDLAVTAGAFQAKEAQGAPCPQSGLTPPCPDAFAARFSEDGTVLRFATYLGGTNYDYAEHLVLDAAGNAIVVGGTYSPDFPATAGVYQGSRRSGALCFNGFTPCPDAFVTILNAAGTALVASTYLGGDGYDDGKRVALDPAGNVVVLGSTGSANFPVTGGVFQRAFGGGDIDSFVSVLGPGLKTLVGSSYLGTSSSDTPAALVLGPNGRVYIANNAPIKP